MSSEDIEMGTESESSDLDVQNQGNDVPQVDLIN
jgi:hypothetical protein